jgi:tetratricopeptide (TPR) repeat protein
VSGAADGDREARIASVLEACAERLRRGEAVDADAEAAEHPDVADTLRRGLANLTLLHQLAASIEADGESSVTERTLGDFRMLREIGRGGVGVVYEAEQVSLGRRVALKVLPLAGVLDPQQVQRFRNEAHAAAQLHHAHIVPVHAVGCERGVHYYAMQFIEGDSLAGVLRDLRRAEGRTGRTPVSRHRSNREPAFVRTVARIGEQAADALDYAHRVGVVHRDVKPGNLLVDVEGAAWVTDFGAARLGPQPALTLTGDLVGTLRYMSPEQALGKRAPVDHRTDVYSLGVTLFELLTLEPAVSAEDPQAILAQIAQRDVPSARARNPAVPSPLDTILAKATRKDPADRYATAEEMAGDLRRFLADRPILARPPTWAERSRHWARRHRVVVGASFGVLLLLVGALAIGAALVSRERDRAEANYESAQRSLEVARRAVNEMLQRVGEEDLTEVPTLEPVRRDLLVRARELYRTLRARHPGDPVLRHEEARLGIALARVHRQLGSSSAVEAVLAESIERLEGLHRELPAEAAFEESLAQALLQHGVEASVARAHEHYDALLRRFPESTVYRRGRAKALGQQGIAARDPERATHLLRRAEEECDRMLERAPDDGDTWYVKAVVQNEQGFRARERGAYGEAIRAARSAAESYEGLVARAPRRSRYRSLCAMAHHNVGTVLIESGGDLQEAEVHLRRSLAVCETAARDYPSTPEHRFQAAIVQCAIADVVGRRPSGVEEAVDRLRQSIRLLEPLAQDPADVQSRRELGRGHLRLAAMLPPSDGAAATRHVAQAIRILERLRVDAPDLSEGRSLAEEAHRAAAHFVARNPASAEEAVDALRESVRRHAGSTTEAPKSADVLVDVARVHVALARVLSSANRGSEAIDDLRRVQRLLAGAEGEARWLLAESAQRLGGLLLDPSDRAERSSQYREALRLYSLLAEERPKEARPRGEASNMAWEIGFIERETGRWAAAEGAFRESVRHMRILVQTDARPGTRVFLALRWRALADVRARSGAPDGADRAESEAIDLFEALREEDPANADHAHHLAGALSDRARRRLARGATDRVVPDLLRAIELQRGALASSPSPADAQAHLSTHHLVLARAHLNAGDHGRASQAAEGAAEAAPDDAERLLTVVWLLAECADLARRDPAIEGDERRGLRAREHAARAAVHAGRALEIARPDPAAAGERSRAYVWALACAHADRLDEARRWFAVGETEEKPGPDVARVRACAARLLGVESPPGNR